jgi:homoserine kinase
MLVPGFDSIKKTALMQKGALGFSFSGSGPSVFAITQNLASARKLAKIIQNEFDQINLESQSYYGEGSCLGARVMTSKKETAMFPSFRVP